MCLVSNCPQIVFRARVIGVDVLVSNCSHAKAHDAKKIHRKFVNRSGCRCFLSEIIFRIVLVYRMDRSSCGRRVTLD